MQVPSPSSSQVLPRVALALLGRARRGNSGFTLIESLVAIIIVSIVVIGIIPPIFYATATRVQNRRAEQAVQLAQSEIDKVRAAVEQHTSYTANGIEDLPPYTGVNIHQATNVPSPPFYQDSLGAGATKFRSINSKCQKDDGKALTSASQYIAVQTDGNKDGKCIPQFFVQIFRSNNVEAAASAGTTAPDGFVMGVRVYSALAANKTNAERDQAQNLTPAPLRGGQGLGFQQLRPMAVLYATVVRSDRAVDVYKQLCATKEGGACPK